MNVRPAASAWKVDATGRFLAEKRQTPCSVGDTRPRVPQNHTSTSAMRATTENSAQASLTDIFKRGAAHGRSTNAAYGSPKFSSLANHSRGAHSAAIECFASQAEGFEKNGMKKALGRVRRFQVVAMAFAMFLAGDPLHAAPGCDAKSPFGPGEEYPAIPAACENVESWADQAPIPRPVSPWESVAGCQRSISMARSLIS